MAHFPDYAQLSNMAMLEELYGRYLQDPASVDPSFRYFFQGLSLGEERWIRNRGKEEGGQIDLFRRYGHFFASFNPLRRAASESTAVQKRFPLPPPKDPFLQTIQKIYCGKIGFEYMHLEPRMQRWFQERIEGENKPFLSLEEKRLLFESLHRSELLEAFLHSRYPGQTRFSLEGAETMIPMIVELIEEGAKQGVEEVYIAMAHRGRLNVLTQILRKPFEELFGEFEDDTTLSFYGNDDVRYHLGLKGIFPLRKGGSVEVQMIANPSHLESVDPVALGQTFARQRERKDGKKEKIIPLLIHGDASIAGQGVVYESLQLMQLPSYSVGGAIHLIINNQIGYTTLPPESRSTPYCTDIAKAFEAPVFHVNAEDPEECLFATKLAIAFRQTFHLDVFLDLYCYRKYGHNEGDEPSFTQPLQYREIRSKTPIRKLYFEQLLKEGKLEEKMALEMEENFRKQLQEALTKTKKVLETKKKFPEPAFDPFSKIESGVDEKRLKEVWEKTSTAPLSFHLHPKLQKLLEEKKEGLERETIGWATAELLAFGSLLQEGVSIRLAGQDSQRGTFSQRHLVWLDYETGAAHFPLSCFPGSMQIVNSPLTEFAGMGFEYGYSLGAVKSLCLWEAQYGDFDNGAQIVIDQYLVSAEKKWHAKSNLVLLLPHGYEGAGPEHSSARIERFLQLAANHNLQIVYPSTPAQYFHLLRRQALHPIRKPLVVFTPKSLLRSSFCISSLKEFTDDHFHPLLEDPKQPKEVQKILLCTGKIFYDLLAARKKLSSFLIRIEQLYPFPSAQLQAILKRFSPSIPRIWVQEEPKNMGAWNFVVEQIPDLSFIGREANATTASGSSKKHKQEQAMILEKALECS